jgi:hypothetical protein
LELSINPATDRGYKNGARSDDNCTWGNNVGTSGMFLRKKRANARVADVKTETFDKSREY